MKRIFSLLLCALLVSSLFAVTAFAGTSEESGDGSAQSRTDTGSTCDAVLAGYQNQVNGTGVRLVASIANVDLYREIGFFLSEVGESSGEGRVSITTVFKTLYAANDAGDTYAEVSAEEGQYLYALALKDAPADRDLTLTVTPYTVDQSDQMVRGTPKVLEKKVGGQFEQVSDVAKYQVENGSFETGDLTGWTPEGGEFGVVTDEDYFWNNPEKVYGKEGTWLFSWYTWDETANDGAGAEVNREDATGTLRSSDFVLQPNAYVSFRFGAGINQAGERIEFVRADNGEILGQFFNTNPNEGVLIPWGYRFSNSEEITCYIRVVDESTSGAWRCLAVDDFVTYYPAGETLAGANEAINAVALKAELAQVIADGLLTEQGDYTADSYAAYAEALTRAQTVAGTDAYLPSVITAAKEALTDAKQKLTLRTPSEVTDAQKVLTMAVNTERELLFADYIDGQSLSSLTYEVTAGSGLTVTDITGGVKLTAGSAGVADIPVTITVKYKGETALTVSLSVSVTENTKPSVNSAYTSKELDLWGADDAAKTVDVSLAVNNPAGLALSYAVTVGGRTVTLTDGSKFVFAETGSYGETATAVVFHVTVSFTADGVADTLEFDYTVNVRDTSGYRVPNGGFEDGNLNGWTISNTEIGAVSNSTHYWLNDSESSAGYLFGKDGEWFFNAYATDVESAKGTLTSSPFIIGNSGWLTFKLGAAKNVAYVYIDIIDADTGVILARFGNTAWADRTNNIKSGCTLIAYKADLSAFRGRSVRIRIVDNATSDYGLIFADSFNSWYDAEPGGEFLTAVPQDIYSVTNGGFEDNGGSLNGWTLEGGEFGVVSSDTNYWGGSYEDTPREGNHLFSWWTQTDGVSREGETGRLISNTFVLKAGSIVSFKFGGGCGNQNIRIEFVNADTGDVLAKFYNTSPQDGKLIQYWYQFGTTEDVNCFIRVVDEATSGWGVIAVDDFVVNATEKPGIEAINQQ